MKKFIYKIYTPEFASHIDDDYLYDYFNKNDISYADENCSLKEIFIKQELNSLGRGGWELLSVIDKKDKTSFYFKREI